MIRSTSTAHDSQVTNSLIFVDNGVIRILECGEGKPKK